MSNADKRPLSPHLTVYRWKWTMVMSILHRATGIALVGGTLLLAWWLVAAAAGPGAFAMVQGVIGSWIGLILLFGWTWSLMFHLANGIRHLVWDAGYSFELINAERGAYIVAGTSAVLTIVAWIVGVAAW
jgi:succinate dehydrogenase / fumarate reductase, cytochrome b subunit